MRLPWSRPAAGPVALPAPTPDGAGWPDVDGRPSFAASAVHELGLRNAYEIEAHAVADQLVDRLLPLLPTGADAQDAPYLRKVLLTAARVGAGLGMAAGEGDAGTVDAGTAGALLVARQALPRVDPGPAQHLPGYFLLAGFRVVRCGPDEVDRLEAALRGS